MTLLTINDKLANIARSYIGEKEISGNKGFENSHFESLMQKMGWKKFQAWCVYFGESVWKEGYEGNEHIIKDLDNLFSASAVQTWKNFYNSKRWESSQDPVKGALAIWQRYKDGKKTWMGHLGIVEDYFSVFLTTIDGNTSGGLREGDRVDSVTRKYNRNLENGLNLLGFVRPKQIYMKLDNINIKKV